MNRDETICDLYKNHGATPKQLASRFTISVERVRQILKAGNVYKKHVAKQSTEEYLGLYTDKRVKKALKDEAAKQNTSVSSLSVKAIVDMLVDLGYERENLTKTAVDRLVHE